MGIITSSSNETTVSEKKQDSFGKIWEYNNELRAENQRLKSRLAFLEQEIKLLLPAAFFLRTRDAVHRQLSKYSTLVDACRAYRKKPGIDRVQNIMAALKALETEEKF
jgi:hypothetical protein